MYVMPSVYSWELQPKSNDEMPNTFPEEYNKIKFYGELV